MTSACRYCRFYEPEGRRGGMCSQLGAMVQASWESCSLANSPFESPWEQVSDIALLENSLALEASEAPLTNIETEVTAIEVEAEVSMIAEVLVSRETSTV